MLTALNLTEAGGIRGTVFYVLPVAIVAWSSLGLRFVFAGISVLAVWIGGRDVARGAPRSAVSRDMWDLLKLSVIELGAHQVIERMPRRDKSQRFG